MPRAKSFFVVPGAVARLLSPRLPSMNSGDNYYIVLWYAYVSTVVEGCSGGIILYFVWYQCSVMCACHAMRSRIALMPTNTLVRLAWHGLTRVPPLARVDPSTGICMG